jgi:hypothetical protein
MPAKKGKFKRYAAPQLAILKSEYWFGDDPPDLGEQFTAALAEHRSIEINAILARAAKRVQKEGDSDLAGTYRMLLKKLTKCRTKARCGSMACAKCARAFQRAKTAAHLHLIDDPTAQSAGKTLVMATLIPMKKQFRYLPASLSKLAVRRRNRWFLDQLREIKIRRVMVGSLDISWEEGTFYQIHWHIAVWTSNPAKLHERLKKRFVAREEYTRPVHVASTWSTGFVRYMHKVIELPKPLLHNRRNLPPLLVELDRTEPFDPMILMRVKSKATTNGFAFYRIS